MKQTCRWFYGASLMLLSLAVHAGSAVDTLQPGHWYEVPNSRLEGVAPTPFDSRIRNVIEAWSGAAYDTKRDRLIVWGGGHNDYWGNEIYVFDVNKLAWERLNDPYWPARDMDWGTVESFNADGAPSSRHTYDGLAYLPEQDRFWIMGGSRWRSGAGDQVTAVFNFDTLRWSRMADASVNGTIGVASAYDPVTGYVFLHGGGTFMRYDPSSNTWKVLRQDSSPNGLVGEIDPVNRKFVLVGKGSAYVYDITNPDSVTRSSLNAVGDKSMEGEVPGLSYDPVARKIVAWHGGSSVYTLDLSGSTPVWTRITPASGNSVTPTEGAKWGTYGRWRYIPSKGVFIGVNSTSGNVYFYKLSENAGSGGAPPPSEPLPTVDIGVSPAIVSAGESALVTWTTSNASSCTASGAWSGSRPVSGTFNTGALAQNRTYTLRCTGAGGSRERSATVVVSGGDSGGSTPGGDQADLVGNLTVQDTANASNWAIRTDFQARDVIHGDRAFEAVIVPQAVKGADWVQTANDSKSYGGATLAAFVALADVDVYVAHRDDIANKPAWLLDGWEDSGLNLVNDEPKSYSLYRKRFGAGDSVQLGPNGSTTSGMYIVLVLPAAGAGGGDGPQLPPKPEWLPGGPQPAGETRLNAPYFDTAGEPPLLAMEVEVVRESDQLRVFRRVIAGQDEVLIPPGILDAGQTYRARARHQNNVGWSVWSDDLTFQSLALDFKDLDGDGTDDRYQLSGSWDVDGNGIPDADEPEICGMAHPAGGVVGLRSTVDGSRITCVGMIEAQGLPAGIQISSGGAPWGFMNFRIDGLPVNAGNPARASVVVYLPQAIESGMKWYGYDQVSAVMHDRSVDATGLTEGSSQIMISLQDGGDEDADGTVNGVIVVQGGVITAGGLEQVTGAGPASGEDGGAGSFGIIELLLAVLGGLGLLTWRRRTARPLPALILGSVGLAFGTVAWAASSVIDIPNDTWVARALPGNNQGPWAEIKHMRQVYNPSDGRIYFLGGDFGGTPYPASGRNEIYSYSVRDDEWRLEHPYCRDDAGYQPAGPDQVGWVYDTRRDLFWVTPGYMTPGTKDKCGPVNADKMLLNAIMAYDPHAKKWIYENRSLTEGSPSIKKFAQYDPETDTIIRFAWTGSGPRVEIYDIEADRWSTKGFGGGVSNARVGQDYTAMDLVDRVIYMVSPLEGRLLRYDMDAQTLANISDLPTGPVNLENSYPVWDSVNRVLLWYRGGSNNPIEFYVYHPDTNTWESRPVNQPQGLTVRGNSAVFDPVQNVLLVIGGYSPANPNLFLYRYAEGNGSAPPPSNPLPTVSLSASTSTVASGQTAQLAWSASNASSCTASGAWSGPRPLSGSAETAPLTQSSTFTLSCTGTGGTRERSVTVGITGSGGGGSSPGSGPSTGEPSSLIGNLAVQDGTNAAHWATRLNIHGGDRMYGDRTYGVVDIPEELMGADWIQTANASRSHTGSTVATFLAKEPVDVYVAHRDDNTPKPAWLGSWTDTGLRLTNDEPRGYTLFHKSFAAGETVQLGPNGGGNTSGMYIVLIQASEASADPQAPDTPVLPAVGQGIPVNGFQVSAPYSASSGGAMTAAEWEITRSSDGLKVYRRVLEGKEGLSLPSGVLDISEDYWIRVRHQNGNGWSEWSEHQAFQTAESDPNDSNGDGIDDRYQVNGNWDVDGNGLIDAEEDEICNLMHPSGGVVGIRTMGAGSRIACRTVIEAGALGLAAQQVPYGFLSFRIEELPVNSAEVSVAVYLPEPIVAGSRWYKYDEASDTFFDYSNRVSGLTAGSRQVIVRLVDGGDGDADGVMNGVIVDPGGLVTASGAQGIASGSNGSNSGGSSPETDGGPGALGPVETLVFIIGLGMIAFRFRASMASAFRC